MYNVYLLCVIFCTYIWGSYGGLLGDLLYSNWIKCDHDKSLNLDVSQVRVYLYDFQNNYTISYQFRSAEIEGIFKSYKLDTTRKLIFFVPGYKSPILKNNVELIKQTFSNISDIYLIIIDHSEYTYAKGGAIKGYERSVLYTSYIGTALGKFIAGFRQKGIASSNIHAIGHSLGAHMLGFAGKAYTEQTGEKIFKITGLDPAGPCFSNGFVDDQIRSGVASYVEVYHCNVGGLGTRNTLADIDFFMNKGRKQPTCHQGIIPGYGESKASKCSHRKCVEYYAKSVHHPDWYLAWACDSYEHLMEGKCARNQVTLAGYSNPGNATGIFYVSTETYGVI